MRLQQGRQSRQISGPEPQTQGNKTDAISSCWWGFPKGPVPWDGLAQGLGADEPAGDRDQR